jgi:hypothetical protein
MPLNNNEELQMINGTIQSPSSVNYSNNRPPGPNYIGIQTGSFGGGTGYRWALFTGKLSSSVSNTTITLGTPSAGFNTNANPINNFMLYVKITGGTDTNGWINGNFPYPGGGSPTNDGDGALDPTSTSAARIVTFGGTPRQGTVLARIGLPSGSALTFKTVTIT